MSDQSARLAASVSHISLMSRPFGAPRIHMDENAASAPADGEVANYAPPLPADAPEIMTVAEAARSLTSIRNAPPDHTAPQSAERAEPEQAATADTPELADEANADPLEAAPGEEPDAIDPAAEPPIEPPRSWAQERKEQFKALPRDLQQYVADRVQEQDRDFRTRQNEVAETQKGLVAQQQEVAQAKQKYEAGIEASLRALEREQLQQFPDIKTWEDVKAMQRFDPLRYQEWDVHQKELALVSAQATEVRERQEKDRATNRTNHIQRENELASETIPELADEKKGQALRTRAEKRLGELGFKPAELADLANGKTFLSIYDHRVQRLIHSDLRLAEIQQAKTAVVTKPVPQVQRPGTARNGASPTTTQQIQALEKQLTNATGNKAAQISAQIMQLERKSAAR